MLNNQEEDEKKKREQEAQNIIASLNPENSISSSVNFSNDNGFNIQTQNENEKTYLDRINEANSIINSINPREETTISKPTQEEIEESRKNTQDLINLMDYDPSTQTQNQTDSNNYYQRKNQMKTEEEIKQQAQKASVQGANVQNQNQGIVDKDVKISLANPDDVENAQTIDSTDIKAMEESTKKNENIEKGGISKFNETIKTVLDNIYGGAKQTVSGLVNILTSAVGFGIRGLEGAAKIVGLDEQAESLNNAYNSIIDTGSSLNKTANYEKTVTSQTDDDLIRTAGDVTNTISNMLSSYVIGYVAPVSSTAIMGLSAGGNAAQEVLDENKDNIGQATLTGIAKGYSSYLTEKMFDANILTRGTKKSSIQEGINRLIANKINSEFGKEFANRTVGIIGENIEEIVDNNAGYLIDKLINNKDLPDFKQWFQEQSETVKITTLSTMAMSLLGLGGTNFKEIEGDMEANYWIDQAQQIVDQEQLAIHFNPNEVQNLDQTEDFYITRFTPDGEIANIVATKGKPIYNSNPDIDVTPVIVKDSEIDMYNVIDGNTGVVLDSTPYYTQMEAEAGFNEKVRKLSDLQVRDINSKVSEAQYMITDEIMKTVTQSQEQLNQMTPADYNVNVQEDTTTNIPQTNDINQQQVLNSQTTNIISQNPNALKMEDRTVENVSDKNVKSYQSDFPEIATDIQEMAVNFQEDLANSIPGERYRTGDTWTGQKRNTTTELAEIKDETGASWDKIGQALEDISKGNGDYALAKKIELVLDDALTNGYTNIYGQTVSPNENYISKKSSIEGKDYAKIEEDYDPTKYMTQDDLRVFGERKVNNNVRAEKIRYENNGQETNRTEERKNTRGEEEVRRVDELDRKRIQDKLKKYQKQEQEKLGKDFRAKLTKTENLTRTERVVSDEFKNITGLNYNFYETNKPNTQSAFFLDNELFGKHNSLSSKKKTNFLPYHELGHWLKINQTESWNKIHDIIDNTLTNEQIDKYKDVLNDKSVFENMSEKEVREYVIEEIESDYIGNWANDIYNWADIIRSGKLSQDYIQLLIDISERNVSTHYNIFGTEEQQERVYAEISNVMKDFLGMDITETNIETDINYSDRNFVKEFHNRIQNAINNKNSKGRTYLGDVSESIAKKVKKILGIEVSNRRHVLADNDIRHIINEHGNPKIEESKGQIAVTLDDIEKIPEIIATYNSIVKGTDNKEGNTIRYIKKYSDNISYVVEVVPSEGNALKIKTMWKKPVRVTNSQKTPSSTPKTKPGLDSSTSNNSITSNTENVKMSDRIEFNEDNKVNVIHRKFTKDFQEKGYIDLNDKKINSIEEVADVSQIFRNPEYETFRVLYLNGDTIVGQEAISSKTPGQTKVFLSENNNKNYYKMQDRMKRLNADGYYMIHNHPSGKAKLSSQDLKVTEDFRKNVHGFKGHVVVNSGTYAYVDIDGNYQNEVEIKNYKPDEIDKMLSNEPWTKIQFNSPEQIAKIMYDVKNNPNYSTLILTDSRLYGRIIIDIPNTFLNMKGSQIEGYIRNIARQNGADRAFLATTNEEAWNKSKKIRNITDSILYNSDQDDLYAITSSARENNEVGNKIFEIGKKTKATRVGEEQITDNKGNVLSNEQQEYFKDSKVRDNDGNLLVMYHGTDSDFNIFKYNNLGKNGLAYGKGFYFTDSIESGKAYGNILKQVYLDIKKPLQISQKTMTKNDFKTLIEVINQKTNGTIKEDYGSLENALMEYDYGGDDIDLINSIMTVSGMNESTFYSVLRDTLGYDGIKANNKTNGKDGNIYVVFNSNQIKNIDNKNPTENEDIRYINRQLDETENAPYDERIQAKNKAFIEEYRNNIYRDVLMNTPNEQASTNAQGSNRWIEQEIQKIEQSGDWDNTIPITKLTDIRKTIEDYLGMGVKKGGFRQRVYGLYKQNSDTIRVKEYKDIDNILHEAGHAIDLGKRLNVDKESIASELFTAVDRHGGYEEETREVRLEEGFAEIIREYGIVPEQAKIDYPQTVAVLEKLRQGDKGFDKFITTVQQQIYNYIHQNPINRTLSNLSIGERTDRPQWSKKYIAQEVMRNIYDRDWTLKKAVNEIEKQSGKKTRASENAYYLTRLVSGIGGKTTSMLANGYIDENGNKLMPGLSSLGEILGNDPERFNDLRAYLVAQRDLEYKARTLKTGIRTMDTKAVVEQFKNDSQIQQASKLVYDTLDGVLQYAVNNGLITQDNADSLRASNVFYVPMQRNLDGRNRVGRKGAVTDIIKARTGSELDVKDVLENIISNSANIIQQVENNNVLKALYKQGEQAGMTGKIYDVIPAPLTKVGTAKLSTWESELKNQGVDTTNIDFEKTIDLFAPNNKIDTNNLITSFIDESGKRVYLQFNDETLFNSIMNMDQKFMGHVLNLSGKFNMPLRYGATMANIGFAIPNVISDTAQAAIFSEAGFIPVVDNILGVMDIVSAQNRTAREFFNKIIPGYADRINTMYALYEQSGATSSTRLSQYRESTQVLMKDVYGTKNNDVLGIKEKYKPLKRLLDIFTYIPEVSEQSTRFRIFEKNLNYYRRTGLDETDARIQAALQSRDATQDFNRTGVITKEINQLIPFSAARVGSAYTFAEKVKANPKRVAMRMSLLTVIAMAIKAVGYNDKEIEELNQEKKNDNFVFKMGDNIITIKKPQGVLRSIINLTEYVQDLFTGNIEEGKEGERLAELLQSAIMDNAPADHPGGYIPNIAAPIIENWANKDFYYNTDIVKSYDLDLPDSEQYYDYNSQLAIWLGKIFNYSPAKIDNLISGYFAGLGTSVTNVIDWIAGKTGITSEQPEMGAEDNAVAKRFIVNVNSNSASVDDLYTMQTDLTKKKNGGTITKEEEQQLEDIENAISEISKVNKQIKEIKKDLTMSGDEKADQIKLLQEQKVDTARLALGKGTIYQGTEEKIESTVFYPSTSSLSKNNYTLELTPDMKKEYEELAYNKFKEYQNQGIYGEEYTEKLQEKCKDYAKSQLMKKYKDQLEKKKQSE